MTKLEKIHTAAIELFNEKGFQATSTTSITKHAGVGTGTLFTYYKSKDELVNALYVEVKNELIQHMKTSPDSSGSFEDNLFEIWNKTILWSLKHSKKFLFLNEFQNSPVITKITKEQVSANHNFFTEMISAAQQSNLIRTESIDLLSALMGAQFTATTHYLLANPQEPSLCIKAAYEVLWNGIRK